MHYSARGGRDVAARKPIEARRVFGGNLAEEIELGPNLLITAADRRLELGDAGEQTIKRALKSFEDCCQFGGVGGADRPLGGTANVSCPAHGVASRCPERRSASSLRMAVTRADTMAEHMSAS